MLKTTFQSQMRYERKGVVLCCLNHADSMLIAVLLCRVGVGVLLTNAVRWMKSMCNSIDNEDCALVEQVNTAQSQ